MDKKIAKFIKNRNGTGIGKVYEVEPPINGSKYVWVSALDRAFDTARPETFIFTCDMAGNVTDWMEVRPGSFTGGADIEKALHSAGYEIVGGE